MLKRLLLAGVATICLATPAFAHHCPKDAKAIDAGLAVLNVSDEVKAEVTALRDKGMEQHNAGNHAESEATLAEAMRKLLENAK